MKQKTFKFTNGRTTIEITAPISYSQACQMVPIGYELLTITKIQSPC